MRRSRPTFTTGAGRTAALLLGTVLLNAGCTPRGQFQAISMWNESRLKPHEPIAPGPFEMSARPPIAGAVARGQLSAADESGTGRSPNGALATRLPMPVTRELLARGQDRFDINCSPCHGRTGDGTGIIVRRGFPEPPDYAIRRLRDAPVGHFFDVITNGYGVMYPYGSRVAPRDRWAIAAYIRALQAARPVAPDRPRRMTPLDIRTPVSP